MNTAAKYLALILGFTATSAIWAETYDYQAVTDFTDINAGEVPYYRHNGVNALAINAAIEEYRNKFGRATLVFEHAPGLYNVTITSLGETDGDGTFQFLVNGEVVGSSVNEPATEDYGLQFHTFNNISIPADALIGVESSAVSNGLIPEGDAYAFARGRWTVLSLTTVDEVVPTQETIDLALSMSVSDTSPTEGDEITYSVVVENKSVEFTATNPVVTVTFPNSFSNMVGDSCSNIDAQTLTCVLPELPPTDKLNFSIVAMVDTAGTHATTAKVEADQEDTNTSNNTDTDNINVSTPVEQVVDTTVDLALTVASTTDNLEAGDSAIYSINLKNLHDSNTATSPKVEITLANSLEFQSSDLCSAINGSIICYTQELAPGVDTTFSITANAISVDSAAQMAASASATQTDSDTTNNEVQYNHIINTASVEIVEPEELPQQVQQEVETPEEVTDSTTNPFAATPNNGTSGKSGGGSWDLLLLLCLMIVSLGRPAIATSTKQ